MADLDSSLPIRTENAGDVIAKISDATTPSQQLKVNADGTIDVNAVFAPGTEVKITDGTDTVEVNADGSLNITDNGGSLTVDATNLDIRDLTSASDSVAVLQATHDNLNGNMTIQVADTDVSNSNPVPVSDAGGSLTVDGTVTANIGTTNGLALNATLTDKSQYTHITDGTDDALVTAAGELNVLATAQPGVDIGDVTINNAAGASAVNIQDGGNSLTVDDGGSSLTVDATDLDIRDLTHASDSVKIGDGTDFLAINTDGSINAVIVSEQDGTEVVDYQTSAAVASGASVNHDYTVPGGVTFYGEEAWMSASGKIKVQLLINGSVKWVGFNSTASPNIRIPLEHLAKAAATQVVRITITNNDNQAQDVYSTLLGVTK